MFADISPTREIRTFHQPPPPPEGRRPTTSVSEKRITDNCPHAQTPAHAWTGVNLRSKFLNSLTPLYRERWCPARHVRTVEDRVGP
jgi:hypothetical protein